MTRLRCQLLGLGAWGHGFQSAEQLLELIQSGDNARDHTFQKPSPGLIPANERRRAPLPVRLAVAVSEQAAEQSGLAASELACVFGSGLSDTEITDYICRELNTAQKQLSPTKFHNSVHNAAAGYWTISTGCMKAANSIAAYHETVGLCFLEAMTQVEIERIPVLLTVFDTAAFGAYADLYEAREAFAAAFVIAPEPHSAERAPLASIEAELVDEIASPEKLPESLQALFEQNPAAKSLSLFRALAAGPAAQAGLALAESLSLRLAFRRPL